MDSRTRKVGVENIFSEMPYFGSMSNNVGDNLNQ